MGVVVHERIDICSTSDEKKTTTDSGSLCRNWDAYPAKDKWRGDVRQKVHRSTGFNLLRLWPWNETETSSVVVD